MSDIATISAALCRVPPAVEPPANPPAPLQSYRALRLIQVHAVRPGLAIVLAALAFDGGAA